MAIVQTSLPLADILIETGIGISAMNRSLASNNVGATSADVAIKFCASLDVGFDYASHTHTAGGAFTFWLIGGAGAGWYRNTELHLYREYSESISISVNVHFEPLPDVQ